MSEKAAVGASKFLKNLVEDYEKDKPILLDQIEKKPLQRCVEFMIRRSEVGPLTKIEKIVKSKNLENDVDDWEFKFINKGLESDPAHEALFELLEAANFL